MDFDLGLNDSHQAAVLNYMRFARYQRSQCLKTISLCFQDIKETRLTEETYTQDEVEELLQCLTDAMTSEVDSELLNSAHTSVILLRQLFQQAELWHLKLQADISELENNNLLNKIKSFEEQNVTVNRHEKSSSPIKTKLEPLNESGGSVLLQMKINQLTEDNENLREQMKEIEARAVFAVKEKSLLNEELLMLKAKIEGGERVAGGDNLMNQEVEILQKQLKDLQSKQSENELASYNRQTMEKDLTNTKHRLLEVQMQLEVAEKELEKKFSQTTAYSNLKKMLSKKNEQMKDLRKQLSSYEPDVNYDD